MAHDRGTAEPVRYALLGLLLDRPSHGYDLSRHFSPTSALGDIVYLGASHLYALLAGLERDGLITGQQQEAGARPQRRVYSLTSAGREAVLAWMEETVGHPRDMRIEFPLKLYIAERTDRARAARLVERQRAVFERYIADLESGPPEADCAKDAAFMKAMRAGRIGRARAAIQWLSEQALPLLGTR